MKVAGTHPYQLPTSTSLAQSQPASQAREMRVRYMATRSVVPGVASGLHLMAPSTIVYQSTTTSTRSAAPGRVFDKPLSTKATKNRWIRGLVKMRQHQQVWRMGQQYGPRGGISCDSAERGIHRELLSLAVTFRTLPCCVAGCCIRSVAPPVHRVGDIWSCQARGQVRQPPPYQAMA